MHSRFFVGVDGCAAGWFAVWGDGGWSWECGVFPDIVSLWRRFSGAHSVVIDIPIGLPSDGPRLCDVEARRLLGPRRSSSVFPAPCRKALSASSYTQACLANRAALGKGLSKQCWAICPKIREVDDLLRSDPQARAAIREGHPEVAFAALAGRTMTHRKVTQEGADERLAVLRQPWPAGDAFLASTLMRHRRGKLGVDDMLDAAVMYVIAASLPDRTLPADPERDAVGLPMEMVLPGSSVRGRPG